MTFKIILTVIFAISIYSDFITIDQPKQKHGLGAALFVTIFNAIAIYGFWNWL